VRITRHPLSLFCLNPVVVVGTEGNYLIVKPIFSRDLSS
jgi:hypothetical protein